MDYIIKVEDLAEYEFKHRICGRHGKGWNKTIDAVIKHKSIRYRVSSHKTEILNTSSLTKAVAAYNCLKIDAGKQPINQ
jgi:hypothetical protein